MGVQHMGHNPMDGLTPRPELIGFWNDRLQLTSRAYPPIHQVWAGAQSSGDRSQPKDKLDMKDIIGIAILIALLVIGGFYMVFIGTGDG